MIKESCKCGAEFEVMDGDKNFQEYRHGAFLDAHKVCREAKDPEKSDLRKVKVITASNGRWCKLYKKDCYTVLCSAFNGGPDYESCPNSEEPEKKDLSLDVDAIDEMFEDKLANMHCDWADLASKAWKQWGVAKSRLLNLITKVSELETMNEHLRQRYDKNDEAWCKRLTNLEERIKNLSNEKRSGNIQHDLLLLLKEGGQ